MAYFGRSLGPTILICLMVAICFGLITALIFYKKQTSTIVIASAFQHNGSEQAIPATKVVTLKPEAAVAEQ